MSLLNSSFLIKLKPFCCNPISNLLSFTEYLVFTFFSFNSNKCFIFVMILGILTVLLFNMLLKFEFAVNPLNCELPLS